MRIDDHRRAEKEAQAKLVSVTGLSPKLKRNINAEHHACEEAGRKALKHAIACGELLAEAREVVRKENSSWMTWVKENFVGSKSTEENYRRLANNKKYLIEPDSQRVANLSIRDALALLVPRPGSSNEASDDGEQAPSSGGASGKPGWGGSASKPGEGRPRKGSAAAEPVIYGASDLPIPDSEFANVLGAGKALGLRTDAPVGSERALEAVRSHVDAFVRSAWKKGLDARLFVGCASDSAGLAMACRTAEVELIEEADDEEATEEQIEKYERRVIKEVEKERDDRSLYQIVKEQGRIKPPPENGSVEEYKEIPSCYKWKNGLAGDQMADYLGMYYPQFQIFCENDLIEYFACRRRGRAA